MRLFLGIELPPDISRAVADASEACRERIRRAAPRAVLRWVQRDNLHITLWFLGEVSDERAARVKDVLAQPFRTAVFRVVLQGFGAYPPTGAPRVVWMGIGEGRDGLVALYAELAGRLPTLGFEAERRAYSPHLTLARVKDMQRPAGATVRAALGRRTVSIGSFDVPAVTLFRSRLSPRGSQYEPLLRVPLK